MINRLDIDYTLFAKRIEYYTKYLSMSINSYSLQTFFALERELSRIVDEINGQKFINSRVSEYSANGITVADEYISFVESVSNNIAVLIESHHALQNTVDSYLKYSGAIVDSLDNFIKRVYDSINKVDTTVNSGNIRTICINEKFLDNSKIDPVASTVQIKGGVCRLNPISINRYNRLCKASVIDRFATKDVDSVVATVTGAIDLNNSSDIIGNGFAGNNLECKVDRPMFDCSDIRTSSSMVSYTIKDNSIRYIDPTGSLSTIDNILDTRWDTSFEYEIVNIPDVYKDISCGYGLCYEYTNASGDADKVYWFNYSNADPESNPMMNLYGIDSAKVTRKFTQYNGSNYLDYKNTVYGVADIGAVLRLPVFIKLSSPQEINHIFVDMKSISNTVGTAEHAYVMDVNGSWIECDIDINSDGDISVLLPYAGMTLSSILLLFEQTKSYPTNIIHRYYYRPGPSAVSKDISFSYAINAATSIDNSLSRVDGPNPYITDKGTINKDISYKQVDGIVGPNKEVMPGWRYAIGINHIDISNVVYENVGVYMSNDYITPMKISEISITADTIEYKDDNAFIEFFISVDMGMTWLPISPLNDLSSDAPKKYIIRTSNDSPVIGQIHDSDNVIGSILIDHDVSRVKVKSVLYNQGEKSVSPIIKEYTLILRGELYDSKQTGI